jgi:Ran GTPase-activating protein (RanGAP) involved in mRNA processing and transport
LLDDNKLNAEGTTHLAACLKTKPQITALSLSNNNIGDEGATWLAEAIDHGEQCHHFFPEMVLAGNNIGDAGATKVAELCERNPTLRCLDLRSNKISSAGASALSRMIKRKLKTSVFELQLEDNQISDEGVESLLRECRDFSEVFQCTVSLGGNIAGPRSLSLLQNTGELITDSTAISAAQ